MKNYLRIILFNLKVETKFKADYFIRLLMFMFRILVFVELWDYLLKDKTVVGYTKEDLIWYIIIGEVLIYSMTKNYVRISNMVKNGDIANVLTKPISMLKYIFAMEITSAINFVFNMFFAGIYGFILVRIPDICFQKVVLFLISIIISYFMILFTQIFIGVCAFYLEDNHAIYILISKAIIIVVMTPLDFFKGGLYYFLSLLPTTYIVYAPGKIFLSADYSLCLNLFLKQVIFFAVLVFVTKFITMKGEKKINVNGG